MRSTSALAQVTTIAIILIILVVGIVAGYELSTGKSPTGTSATYKNQSQTPPAGVSFPNWTTPKCTTYTSGTQCLSYINYTSSEVHIVGYEYPSSDYLNYVNLTGLVLVSLYKNTTTTQQNNSTTYFLNLQAFGYNTRTLSNMSLELQRIPYNAPVSKNISVTYNTGLSLNNDVSVIWNGYVTWTTSSHLYTKPDVAIQLTTAILYAGNSPSPFMRMKT